MLSWMRVPGLGESEKIKKLENEKLLVNQNGSNMRLSHCGMIGSFWKKNAIN